MCIRCHTTSLSSDLLEGLSSFSSWLYSWLRFITAKDTEQKQQERSVSSREVHYALPRPSYFKAAQDMFSLCSELQGCVCNVSAQGSLLYSKVLRLLCGWLVSCRHILLATSHGNCNSGPSTVKPGAHHQC